MKQIFIGLTSLLFLSNLAFAKEFDFFVSFLNCKNTAAYLVQSEESLKVFDGVPSNMGCSRESNKISCTYKLKKEQAKTAEYSIILDSPPLLYFSTNTGAEFVAIDTSQHAVAIITRIVGEKYIGSKVCQGIYATAFEIKLRNI